MITLYGFPEHQPPLFPDLPDPVFSPRALGLLGELTALAAFQRAGYNAERQRDKKRGDLLLVDKRTGEQIRVEVKTARKSKNGTWQFCLYRRKGRVCTDYRHADYVVLLAVTGTSAETFVIPTRDLDQKQIAFTNPQKSRKLTPYRCSLGILERQS